MSFQSHRLGNQSRSGNQSRTGGQSHTSGQSRSEGQSRSGSQFRTSGQSRSGGQYRSEGQSRPQSARPRFRGGNGRNQRRRQPADVDIQSFINQTSKQVQEQPVEAYVIKNQFTDFPLMRRLQENITSNGYTIPTPIQDQVINPILEGKDLLGIANTGTGKTGSFLIPLIQKVATEREQLVLVITPTRELALQIESEFLKLSYGMGHKSVLCIGGTSMGRQASILRHRFNFIFGTPGRIKDLIKQRLLPVHLAKTVVLDEVDRMLDMGFITDVREIISHTPKERQSLFFSATTAREVERLIADFSKDLLRISVKTHVAASTISQNIVRFTSNSDKLETLHKLLISEGFDKILIFGRTKHGVNRLSQELNSRGFRTDAIHGNKSQNQRQKALHNFRRDVIKILVATDVAARGLDIEGVSHVINYDLPENIEDYVHRIGRTGRANNEGIALTFVSH